MGAMRARLICTLLAGLAAAGPALAAESTVFLYPALGRPTLVTVTGRVVHGTPEAAAAPLQRNAARLFATSWEGADVAVTFAGQTRLVVTGEDGLFEASFPAPAAAP